MRLINTELSEVKDLFDNFKLCYIHYSKENKAEKQLVF
jgi:hypothetical protein